MNGPETIKLLAKNARELKAYRKQWEKEGKCNCCGRIREDEDKKRCRACRIKAVEYMDRQRRRKSAAKKFLKLCTVIHCNNLAVPGMKMCGYHQEKAGERKSVYQKKCRAEGRCGCGKWPPEGTKVCLDCKERKRQHYIRNGYPKGKKPRKRKDGHCWCGKPLDKQAIMDEKTTCQACRDRFKERHRLRKEQAA